MDGNMAAQVQALKDKADQFGERLKSSWLPRNLTHLAKDSMIWASLKYPLPACTITESESQVITKELFKALLPRLGACRTCPKVYRHAPAKFQGLDIPNLYVERGIGQLRQILVHGAIPTTTGDLLRISLEQAQLEVGIGIPFLEASYGFYGFLLTDTWWKSVWEFIWMHGIELSSPNQIIPQPQRVGDGYIMERLCSQPELSQNKLLSCNRCRLYLEAVTMADIVNGSGRRITDNAMTLQPVLSQPSQWIWPREEPCRNWDLDAWRKGLLLISSLTSWLPRQLHLGAWV
jgi:hypothetical protein